MLSKIAGQEEYFLLNPYKQNNWRSQLTSFSTVYKLRYFLGRVVTKIVSTVDYQLLICSIQSFLQYNILAPQNLVVAQLPTEKMHITVNYHIHCDSQRELTLRNNYSNTR
jgi:hypothetical protein